MGTTRKCYVLATTAACGSDAQTKSLETIMKETEIKSGLTDKPRKLTAQEAETCARAAHELNRAWCLHHGDTSQVSWDEAPAWQRQSCITGVIGVENGNGPAESHAGWTKHKLAEGWTYGPVKDAEKKTHPCLVPYNDLPETQKIKDRLFVNTVLELREAFLRLDPVPRYTVDGFTHAYQSGLTLSGREVRRGEFGETLCQRIVVDWFGSDKQMGLVGPLPALYDPDQITCTECQAKLPALAKQIYGHDGAHGTVSSR